MRDMSSLPDAFEDKHISTAHQVVRHGGVMNSNRDSPESLARSETNDIRLLPTGRGYNEEQGVYLT